MLLLLAASFALHPNFTRADTPDTAPDGDCVALLGAAAGLPERARKTTAAEAGEAAEETPKTAAYAACLLRYRTGHLSTLPDASGALPSPTKAEAEAALNRLLPGLLRFDIAPYAQRMQGKQTKLYRTYAENAATFVEMSEMVRVRTERAMIASMPAAARDIEKMGLAAQAPPAPYNLPDWRSLAALYCVYGDKTLDMLEDSLCVTLIETGDGKASMEARFGTHDAIASAGTRKQSILARFAYAYLNTAFDETGKDIVTEKRVYDDAYLATVTHPLPGYLIKDGWFDPRDRGTRYHTGTDIRAPGGTRIRSVTDGTVLYIGYLPIPGNYVIIRDPYGYEYHYYHLRERTQFVREGDEVKQGDIVGRVGNTGNSAANHLHLTIVSPEYAYVNPYDLFLQSGATPIRPSA